MIETDEIKVDQRIVELNLVKTRAVMDRLRQLGCRNEKLIGVLGADLGDLYAGATRFQELLDAWLELPIEDRDGLDEILVDLSVEMRHLWWHLRSGTGRVERLADID